MGDAREGRPHEVPPFHGEGPSFGATKSAPAGESVLAGVEGGMPGVPDTGTGCLKNSDTPLQKSYSLMEKSVQTYIKGSINPFARVGDD